VLIDGEYFRLLFVLYIKLFSQLLQDCRRASLVVQDELIAVAIKELAVSSNSDPAAAAAQMTIKSGSSVSDHSQQHQHQQMMLGSGDAAAAAAFRSQLPAAAVDDVVHCEGQVMAEIGHHPRSLSGLESFFFSLRTVASTGAARKTKDQFYFAFVLFVGFISRCRAACASMVQGQRRRPKMGRACGHATLRGLLPCCCCLCC
jgi:hypothetical protein